MLQTKGSWIYRVRSLEITDETAQTSNLNVLESSDGRCRGSDASHASKDDPTLVVLHKVETTGHRRWAATVRETALQCMRLDLLMVLWSRFWLIPG